jgi:sRNA-binding carbon storage regulator CsrA
MVEPKDKILIGDEIMITVLHNGKRPQLAIDAPKDLKIILVKEDIDRMFLNRKAREAKGE